MRRFFAGLMVGLIVLTGMLSVVPHDDFQSDHSHDGGASSELVSNTPSNDTSDAQDVGAVMHCDAAAHFFTTSCPTDYLALIIESGHGPVDENDPLTHTAAPATPPPIL